jgi:hypothetical protein
VDQILQLYHWHETCSHHSSRNLSLSCIWWNICIQNSLRTTLSASVRRWTMDSMYAFMCKRFHNTRHTVTFGVPVSQDARRIDFRGLRTELSLSWSICKSCHLERSRWRYSVLQYHVHQTCDVLLRYDSSKHCVCPLYKCVYCFIVVTLVL